MQTETVTSETCKIILQYKQDIENNNENANLSYCRNY